jgi:hypothetical protein
MRMNVKKPWLSTHPFARDNTWATRLLPVAATIFSALFHLRVKAFPLQSGVAPQCDFDCTLAVGKTVYTTSIFAIDVACAIYWLSCLFLGSLLVEAARDRSHEPQRLFGWTIFLIVAGAAGAVALLDAGPGLDAFEIVFGTAMSLIFGAGCAVLLQVLCKSQA